jgi:ATP-dependent helicase/nuclease subunit B
VSSVFRFLKSGLTDFDDDKICTLENYCLAMNIKGYSRWHSRFEKHTDTAKADELMVLNETRENLISKCDLFTNELAGEGRTVNAGSVFTVKQFCVALYRLIEAEHIEEKLKTAAERFKEEGDDALFAQYEKIYVKIMNILE